MMPRLGTRNSKRRGNTILESAMLIPVIVLLMVGMVQIAKITYLYFTLKKTVYSVASYLSTQQGVNFCDSADPTIAAAINFGLTGSTDNSLPVFVGGLTPDMISVTPQRLDGIDYSTFCAGSPSFSGARPDFITVSIPNGFLVQLRIPMLPQMDPIPLKPSVQVPYAGT
jgi:hypothetical protein